MVFGERGLRMHLEEGRREVYMLGFGAKLQKCPSIYLFSFPFFNLHLKTNYKTILYINLHIFSHYSIIYLLEHFSSNFKFKTAPLTIFH